jgi:hypothetical protein
MTRAANLEFDAFNRTMDQLLSVSHDELKRRMDAYKKESAKNPNRRGPKPKRKNTKSRNS